MKIYRIIAGVAVMLALAAGCKSQYDILLESNDVDAKYAAAFQYYNEGKYTRAASLFESLAMLTNRAVLLGAEQLFLRRIPYR